MRILEFTDFFDRVLQISLDERFLGQFVEALDGHNGLPNIRSTVLGFNKDESTFVKMIPNFVPERSYKGIKVIFEDGETQQYWQPYHDFSVVDRPDSDFGVSSVGTDPLAEIEDLNIRLSEQKPKFKHHDRVKMIGGYKFDGMSFDEIYTVDNPTGTFGTHHISLLEVPSSYHEGKGRYGERCFELVNEDPLAEIEDLNVKLSQRYKFKVGDKVKSLDPLGSEMGTIQKGNIYEVAGLLDFDAYWITLVGKGSEDFMSHRFELVPAEEDPLAEIEDLNVKLSQLVRTLYQAKDMSYTKRGFAVGDKVVVVVEQRDNEMPDSFELGKTIFTIAEFYSCPRGMRGERWLVTLKGEGVEIGFWVGELEKATDIDPLAEIEDLNVRLSRIYFKPGARVALDPGSTRNKEGFCGMSQELKFDIAYTVLDCEDVDRPILHVTEKDRDGEYMGGYTDRFKLFEVADPLAEIEDLNVRLGYIDCGGTNQNFKTKFNIGDKVRFNPNLTDSDISRKSNIGDPNVSRDLRKTDNMFVVGLYNDMLAKVGAGWYFTDECLISAEEEDPLAEIEDLNIILSQHMRTEEEARELSRTSRGFQLGDKVKFVCNVPSTFTYPEGMVPNQSLYEIRDVRKSFNICWVYLAGLSEGTTNLGWWAGQLEKVNEDPLAEIEDLNIVI